MQYVSMQLLHLSLALHLITQTFSPYSMQFGKMQNKAKLGCFELYSTPYLETCHVIMKSLLGNLKFRMDLEFLDDMEKQNYFEESLPTCYQPLVRKYR